MELENAGSEEQLGSLSEPRLECVDALGGESTESKAPDAAELHSHGAAEI
ncbi:hypothetical protein ACWDSL_51985 [Streptomyces sp. NPDC000941]